MKPPRLFLFASLIALLASPALAWVVRDRVTDVYQTASGDLFAVRRIRRNEQLNDEEAVWQLFWNADPARPLLSVGFKDGQFAHHWEWKEGLSAFPRGKDLSPVVDRVTMSGEKAPLPEDQFRSLLSGKLKMAAVEPSAHCGAELREDPMGYTLTAGGVSRKLNWVHANSAGQAFQRNVDRCYEAKGLAGVVIRMSGTVTAPAEDGAPKKNYPNFSTETFIWMKEPPKS